MRISDWSSAVCSSDLGATSIRAASANISGRSSRMPGRRKAASRLTLRALWRARDAGKRTKRPTLPSLREAEGDAAIQGGVDRPGLLRSARNDEDYSAGVSSVFLPVRVQG